MQAAMEILRDDKFRRALNVLCPLPTKMARAMVEVDKKVNEEKASRLFRDPYCVSNLPLGISPLPRKAEVPWVIPGTAFASMRMG